MVLTAAAGTGIGLFVERNRAERRAVEALSRIGSVQFDYQYVDGDPLGVEIKNATSPGAAWLRKLVGDEPFRTVVAVVIDRPAKEEDMIHLERLKGLRYIFFHRTEALSDEAITNLAGLHKLEYVNLYRHPGFGDPALESIGLLANLKVLHLDGTSVSDVGTAHLAGLSELEEIDLDGTNITDATFETLSKLPKLKRVYASDTPTTASGVQALKARRPGVAVSQSSREATP
jgi:hypothetical protein